MVKNPNLFLIGIKVSTKKRLETVKHTGQSWDGIINELLEEHELSDKWAKDLHKGFPDSFLQDLKDGKLEDFKPKEEK